MNGASPTLEDAIEAARRTGEFRYDQPLDELPGQLRGIAHLISIKLEFTHLPGLPDWLTELDQLHILSISDASERMVPFVIRRLHQLHHLAISGLRADAVADGIAQLPNLETLVLTSCGLRHVPADLANRATLRSLDLSHNALDPESVDNLPEGLTFLSLWGTGLHTFPSVVRRLQGLEVLLLSARGAAPVSETVSRNAPVLDHGLTYQVGSVGGPGQALTDVPAWLAEACPRLGWLDLAGNRLTELPDEFVHLRELRGLILTENQIERLPGGLLAMPSLEILAAESNRLTELPARWNTERLRYVGLGGNPLPIPPEILVRADAPTRIWTFINGKLEESRPLNEAKLLVVGEASVGKTSIIRRLTQDEYDGDERITTGIEVNRWSVPVDGSAIALNVWDFGGQEIMHATHQFFLTRRSVYLLVVNARQSEDQNKVEYWLKIIQSFSDGSPVIVVGNKCEDAMRLDIDRRGLQSKYPNLVGFVETSCVNRRGLSGLRDKIIDSLRGMPHVRDELPQAFFEVKERLEALEENYLPYHEYQRLCREHGIVGIEQQETLVGFLHNLGTVLCFHEDPRLGNTNVLNPNWVTDGVYALLNAPATFERRGLLEWTQIHAILERRGYRAEHREFIVEIMRRFELCYESNGKFLIPDLLTKEEPYTGEWHGALSFVVKYDILPPNVVGRLLVRMSEHIYRNTVWRTGAVLALHDNKALVKADREDGVITIHVIGEPAERRDLLTLVRAQLRSIRATIPSLASEELVPVPGNDGVTVPYRHLLNLVAAGDTHVVPVGLTKKVPISTLLEGVERPQDRESLAEAARSPRWRLAQEISAVRPSLTLTQLMIFGTFMVAALLALIGGSVWAAKLVQGQAAMVIEMATIAAVAIGLLLLAAGGLINQGTLLEGLRILFGRRRLTASQSGGHGVYRTDSNTRVKRPD